MFRARGISEALHLFTRIDDEVIAKQVEKLHAMSYAEDSSKKTEPISKNIGFDDFVKLDIRTATIVSAERVPKADKLLKIEVDLGDHKRTVVSGIAEHYSPDEIVGKQVSMLTNLEPRKIRGVMSQGMILMAEDKGGKLCFVSPEKTWDNGSTIR